jgi:hydroxymethylbilane synthase
MSDIRIGTRGSQLALTQANMVRDLLLAAHELEHGAIEIVVIRTTGDKVQDRPLSELGGKGLFTKEIEFALAAGDVDLAVHSMKDVPTDLPDGLMVDAILERADPRDAFISTTSQTLKDLPRGALVGSSSLRRAAQTKRLRPDLHVIDYRGNVDTRLRKLDEGVVAATFLACAGLTRLGLQKEITSIMSVDHMLPALAQGAIGIEVRHDNTLIRDIISLLNHGVSAICVAAERAFLAALDGSCRTPIAGLATIKDNQISFHGMIISPDGVTVHEIKCKAGLTDAEEMGREAGLDLKMRGGPSFFIAS